MKKIFIICVVIFASFAFNNVVHAADYCEGVQPIEIDLTQMLQAQAWQIVNTALANYDSAQYKTNGRYELCFDFQGALKVYGVSQVVSFPDHPPSENLDVVISGIKLTQNADPSAPLLTINYPYAKVILVDLEITNASKGLEVIGTDIEIVNPTISGDNTGPCVRFFKMKSGTIQGGEFYNCTVGILLDHAYNTLIGAEDAQNYEQDKVLIHNNGVGIHLLSGDGNRWGYNSIYENDSGLNPEEKWKDGIDIANNANNGIIPLVAKKQTESGGILACEKNEAGKIISRKIEFENASGQGIAVIYRVTADNNDQGKDYIAECEVGTDGMCVLNEVPSWLSIPEAKCGLHDLRVTFIFTTDGSSIYAQPMIFDGDSSVIMPESEIPIEAGFTDTSGDSTVSSDEGGGSEADLLGGGVGGSAGGGAGMKCGGTLVPSATLNGPALLHSLFWMTLPLLPIVAIRRKR